MAVPEREDKPAWSAVPVGVRDRVARALGSPVTRAVRAYGGYAPSATFRLTLADGRRAFFKGSYPLPASSGVRWFLPAEDKAYRRLGRYMRPWAPALIAAFRTEGWHVLLMEEVHGESVLPWTAGKARRAARSYAQFHRNTYGARLPAWLSRTQHQRFGRFWAGIAKTGSIDDVAGLANGERAVTARWLRRALPVLVRAERRLVRAREPFVLMHFDTRSDNVRLEGDLLRIFDWPFPSVGPHEFELAAFAQSITSEGGPACESVVAWYSEVLPVREPELIGSVAGIAGYFADRAPKPPPVGLPRLRSVQRRQLKASLAWAARALDLPDPEWLASVRD